jgi:hypothetical protein
MSYCAGCGTVSRTPQRFFAIEAACFVDEKTYHELLILGASAERQTNVMTNGWNMSCGPVPLIVHLSMRKLTVYGSSTADKAIRRILSEHNTKMPLSADTLDTLKVGDKRIRWGKKTDSHDEQPNDIKIKFTKAADLTSQAIQKLTI